MNIADRIQTLRKAKGMSQEELAARIGVSRQAVSKWESQQSMPDIEKIILLSDCFEVSTDYLLRGVEPVPEPAEKRPDAGIFTIAATALNAIGLIAAILVWWEERTPGAMGVGAIVMAVGCAVFDLGQTIGDNASRPAAKKRFWMVNVWLLSLMPYSFCYHLIDGALGGFTKWLAPIPIPGNSLVRYGLCWLVYFAGCILADGYIAKRAAQ